MSYQNGGFRFVGNFSLHILAELTVFPGCCHTDLHAAIGDWPIAPMTPLIGGHEGVGIVVAIGDNTNASYVYSRKISNATH